MRNSVLQHCSISSPVALASDVQLQPPLPVSSAPSAQYNFWCSASVLSSLSSLYSMYFTAQRRFFKFQYRHSIYSLSATQYK
ncbi:hypothetical protein FKM82_000430 [Ascaphus truei]